MSCPCLICCESWAHFIVVLRAAWCVGREDAGSVGVTRDAQATFLLS